MAERKRIALIFDVNPNWMGGTYYVLNIIHALNTLPKDKKPKILLLTKHKEDFEYVKKNTKYPHLENRVILNKKKYFKRGVNKIFRKLLNKMIFDTSIKIQEEIDIVYPILNFYGISTSSRKKYWIPDFQHNILPEYFSKKEILLRNNNINRIIQEGGEIVLSSKDSENSLIKFFPKAINIKRNIYNFTVTIPSINIFKDNILADKYKISDTFFYCSNQFWKHKNHKILFEAIKILKEAQINILLVCSGKTHDYRNPNYFKELQYYIDYNQLQDNIKILGLIDREDQLGLMNSCTAMIQPSLFEGWNTSVEEAKALNKFLILSDLEVHKEQAPYNSIFFKRNSALDLAEKIRWFLENKPEVKKIDYKKNIEEAALHFMEIIDN